MVQYNLNKRKINIIGIIIVSVIVILGAVAIIGYNYFKQGLTTGVVAYGISSLFIISALLELIPQIIHPYFAIIAAISAGLNVHITLLFAILGSLFGSIIGFEIGRKQGLDFVCSLFRHKKLIQILKFWEKYGYLFVLAAALSPLPYFPIVFGALRMPRKDFVKFGLIPRVIGLLILVYAPLYGAFKLF